MEPALLDVIRGGKATLSISTDNYPFFLAGEIVGPVVPEPSAPTLLAFGGGLLIILRVVRNRN